MKKSLFHVLGPAAVLYALLHVGSSVRFGWFEWWLSASALLMALVPWWLRSFSDTRARGQVGWLAIASSFGIVAEINPGFLSFVFDLISALATSLAGTLLLRLALTVPGENKSDGWRALFLVDIAGCAAAATGIAAMAGPISLPGQDLLLPQALSWAPFMYLGVSCAVTLLLRAEFMRVASGPVVRAANAWALIGTFVTAALWAFAGWSLIQSVSASESQHVRIVLVLGTISLVIGHVAMIHLNPAPSVGPTMRSVATSVISAGLVIWGLVTLLGDWLPQDTSALASAVILSGIAYAFLFRALKPWVHRALAPFRGRLLDAVERCLIELDHVGDLQQLTHVVLGALRTASGSLHSEPLLFLLDPAFEGRIDAAGQPHLSAVSFPEPLRARVLAHPAQVIVREALEARIVRRVHLRPLVEVLVERDALCVIPLVFESSVEGALLVPKAYRRSSLSAEEIMALEKLARRMASLICAFSAQYRAQNRVGDLLSAQNRLQEQVHQLEEQVSDLQTQTQVLARSQGAEAPQGWAAYSEAMRSVDRKMDILAPLEVPVLLVGERGACFEESARRIHSSSHRIEGPFVIAQCAAYTSEEIEIALFGDETKLGALGWLRLTAGGTLVLADIPSIPIEVQRKLANAIACKHFQCARTDETYPLQSRIVATSCVPLTNLVEDKRFDADLASWFQSSTLTLPRLKERKEDLPSLILYAVDRACRKLGRDVIGLESNVFDALGAYEWPGDLDQLHDVVHQAIRKAKGPKLRLHDLPILGGAPSGPILNVVGGEPLSGSYAAFEKRLLRTALERAHGNKSEAARMLGLKRTTFLDKLKKYNFSGASSPISRIATKRASDRESRRG